MLLASQLSSSPWPEKRGTRTSTGPLYGSTPALMIGELAAPGRVLVVVTEDTAQAQLLARELPLFLPEGQELLHLPDWETLPYDNFSPHQDIISDRLRALHRLPRQQQGILLLPMSALMQRLPPRHYVEANSLQLATGQTLDVEALREDLVKSGYRVVDTVYEHGEFALRGSLLDIYPMGNPLPLRIDLLDDEIDTLRSFDPETQRTLQKLDAVELLPAREFPLDRASITAFQQRWYARFEIDHDRCPTFTELSAGRSPGGAEYYLPLFFDACELLLDYLPEHASVVTVGDHHASAQRFWDEAQRRYEDFGVDPRRPLLSPGELFTPIEELYHRLRECAVLELRQHADAPVHIEQPVQPPPVLPDGFDEQGLRPRLQALLKDHRGRVLLCAETTGRREILLESLDEPPQQVANWSEFLASEARFALTVAPIDRGINLGREAPMLVTEAQLFGERVAQRRRRRQRGTDPEAAFRDLNELREGSPVVHMEHGIGRYQGLTHLEVDGAAAEFLTLEYAEGARLYVPVSSLSLISRYAGSDPDLAPLHRLGSEQWEKAQRKAREKANDVAAQLLEVYARREAREGVQFSNPKEDYARFSAGFPFEETPDQAAAIEAVERDMFGSGVMDRLVCGDVGFGKTEVAMRAAFIAAANQRQVAMLVPTTLLAQQHYNSFRDRFASWPVRIEVLSRFRSRADVAGVIERLEAGEVDILIGTHKLLQSDIRFSDLGLLIIDEEHRFGVRQKDAIKALRAEVDILTLTATPIPRTLNMALGGIRDLSIIATPPARRLSIKTFVRESNQGLIKEAVLRETLRGGQVFYVHNEVRTIEERANKLRELLPGLSIAVAHGQMHETQLERVMTDFYHQRHHILLCTTIIETGIDIPNANTIIIDRADKFGLAQLHQLRGRVGRSHHQAYAYLLCPPASAMTADAGKRLEAIEAAGDLGAGYQLATHDLEIRGAGELLGDEQSGQIQSVGFSLYSQLLRNAVEALRRGEIPDVDAPLAPSTEINLHCPALIPEDYLPDPNMRLILYKRIAACESDAQLREMQVEMIDRFGLLPAAVKGLFSNNSLRLLAARLGIRALELGEQGGHIDFLENTAIDPLALVTLVQEQPLVYRLAGPTRLRVSCELKDLRAREALARELLERLAGEIHEAAA
ncbi:MAG: transcription-repair coupling factor [Halieaceae bacterium]|jgi:transcription-repair coupling factor (superfamily II helicase)|nr:transcription-repair coupling factor [Halieaceae bacterium]